MEGPVILDLVGYLVSQGSQEHIRDTLGSVEQQDFQANRGTAEQEEYKVVQDTAEEVVCLVIAEQDEADTAELPVFQVILDYPELVDSQEPIQDFLGRPVIAAEQACQDIQENQDTQENQGSQDIVVMVLLDSPVAPDIPENQESVVFPVHTQDIADNLVTAESVVSPEHILDFLDHQEQADILDFRPLLQDSILISWQQNPLQQAEHP